MKKGERGGGRKRTGQRATVTCFLISAFDGANKRSTWSRQADSDLIGKGAIKQWGKRGRY